MIWIAMALMVAVVVLSLVWPLASRRAARSGPAADVSFYRDLLAEVDDDIARGMIPADEAASARAEVGRRLLAAGRGTDPRGSDTGFRTRRLAAITAAVVLVPLFSLGLYLRIGHPAQPDEPLQARAAAPEDVAAAIAKIETHLAAHPEDGRGFAVIAPVYMRMGRFDDALRAYRGVIAALGDSAEREATLGQAMVTAADGVVTAQARAIFDKALHLDPRLPQARFFVALAAEQDGDKAKAAAAWGALLADAPADAPWRPIVVQHLAALTGTSPAAPVPDAAAGPPSGREAAAIAGLPAAQRLEAIHGMVDGLAARLAQNGRDVEGWLRLIKAYTVLGDAGRARGALRDARQGLAGDAPALTRIDAAARDLGLEG